jgi:hypothetical protein
MRVAAGFEMATATSYKQVRSTMASQEKRASSRAPVLLLAVVVALGLSACGGSSGPSERDAATLLEDETPALAVTCMREGNPQFYCNGKNRKGERLKLDVTVSESGNAMSGIRCQGVQEAIYLVQEFPQGIACKGIGPTPKE